VHLGQHRLQVDAAQHQHLPGLLVEAAREQFVQRQHVAARLLRQVARAAERHAAGVGEQRLADDARDQAVEAAWHAAVLERFDDRLAAAQTRINVASRAAAGCGSAG
jgi:hypothetical protein